jgi:5-methylcytosine-specific restriction protein A
MPTAPPRACATCGRPGCTQHRRTAWQHPRPVDRVRGRQLQRLRARLFQDEPLCVVCLALGVVTVATIRDHIQPLAEGGRDIPSNTQALCLACHDRKTQTESLRGRIAATTGGR